MEIRRLVAWFDEKFYAEVTRNLLWEKTIEAAAPPRLARDRWHCASATRNLKQHLVYIGWLAEHRHFLAGANLSLADFAAAAQLSALDFIGDVDWSASPAAKEWYARMKSRPSFRAILADRVNGIIAAAALRRSGFLKCRSWRAPPPSLRAPPASAAKQSMTPQQHLRRGLTHEPSHLRPRLFRPRHRRGGRWPPASPPPSPPARLPPSRA